MSIGAILRGMVGGLVAALGFAVVIGFLVFQVAVFDHYVAALGWVGSGWTALAAGFVAGRMAEDRGWLHGMFAGGALILAGIAFSDAVGHDPQHIVGTLAMAAVAGLIGGSLGVR